MFFILKIVGYVTASKLFEKVILLKKGMVREKQRIIDAKNETRVTVKIKAGQS